MSRQTRDLPFVCKSLEKGIAESPVQLGRSIQIFYSFFPRLCINHTGINRFIPDAFDHRSKRIFCETFDIIGPARIHVDHPWRDVNRGETRFHHHRVELPPDQRVAAGRLLQLDLALDCPAGGVAVGMEVGRSVVPFNDGDGAAGPEQPLTIGVWVDFRSRMSVRIAELSDVVSFHAYDAPNGVREKVGLCAEYSRPLICTEWLHRQSGNTFDAILPIFTAHRVGWYHWGLVAGRTQTYMHWGSEPGDPVPEIWQHDVFHKDGRPYDPRELEEMYAREPHR